MIGLLSILAMVIALCGPDPAHADAKDRIIREAESYLGTPYGFGYGELFCSKFTAKVYRSSVGADLPYNDNAQRFYGYRPDHRERGDLVLYDEHPRDNDPISHVAIWYGNDRIIHASSYFGDVHVSISKYVGPVKTVRRIR